MMEKDASAVLAASDDVGVRYLSNRFDWAAPGDQQEDAWLVRFCDKDCGEVIFTGPDAEQEAWEYWNRYAPSYNLYVFRLARLATTTKPASDTAVQEAYERAAKVADAEACRDEASDPLWIDACQTVAERIRALSTHVPEAAKPSSPEVQHSEINKDRTAKEESPTR